MRLRSVICMGWRELSEPTRMSVSFVVPARNEERLIADCVDSLRSQRTRFPFEIIVVNNGSTDATAAIAAAHGARVIHEARPGLANARQAGLEAANGDFLIYVDADTRLPDHWAQDIVNLFERDDRLVAVTSDFTFYDGRPLDNLGNLVFRRVLSPVTNFVLRRTGRPEVLIGSAIAVRTDALRRVNGVDLEFQFYGEDTMLACRIHSQGDVRFVRNPQYRTSARRYQQRGLFNVVFRYFVIFALIHLGRIDAASMLARKFRDEDRKNVRQLTVRQTSGSANVVTRHSDEFLFTTEDVGADGAALATDGQSAP